MTVGTFARIMMRSKPFQYSFVKSQHMVLVEKSDILSAFAFLIRLRLTTVVLTFTHYVNLEKQVSFDKAV